MRSSAAMESQNSYALRESAYQDNYIKKSVRATMKEEEPFGWKIGRQKVSETEI